MGHFYSAALVQILSAVDTWLYEQLEFDLNEACQ